MCIIDEFIITELIDSHGSPVYNCRSKKEMIEEIQFLTAKLKNLTLQLDPLDIMVRSCSVIPLKVVVMRGDEILSTGSSLTEYQQIQKLNSEIEYIKNRLVYLRGY